MGNREIKFRAWHPSVLAQDSESMHFGKYEMTYWDLGSGLDSSWFYRNAVQIMQYTGLKDKNGKEIYEGDIVRVRCNIGDDDSSLYSDGLYSVSMTPLYGIQLVFRELTSDDEKNQFPIHTVLSSKSATLGEDYVNQKYDQLAVHETWGENHTFGNRWKQNHYSNDIRVIGNIYENPELLQEGSK